MLMSIFPFKLQLISFLKKCDPDDKINVSDILLAALFDVVKRIFYILIFLFYQFYNSLKLHFVLSQNYKKYLKNFFLNYH